jgi:WD40 repeat protein
MGWLLAPTGAPLVSGSLDHTVRFWDTNTDRVTTHLCRIVGTPLQADWARLIPDLPYQPTCH